ncbi:MAG: hypothetical protein R3C41_04555 [Calditrichia bacterium]
MMQLILSVAGVAQHDPGRFAVMPNVYRRCVPYISLLRRNVLLLFHNFSAVFPGFGGSVLLFFAAMTVVFAVVPAFSAAVPDIFAVTTDFSGAVPDIFAGVLLPNGLLVSSRSVITEKNAKRSP